MSKPYVSAEEVATLLRRIASGDVTVKAVDQTWDEAWAGNVTFLLSTGDELVIFNDCDEFDYVDRVKMADGRRGEFDDWWDDEDYGSPGGLLSEDDFQKVYLIFKAAQK